MLSLFLFIPFLTWWYVNKTTGTGNITVSTSRFLLFQRLKIFFRHLPFVLRLLAVAAIIVDWPGLKLIWVNDDQGRGIDIILCIDVSGSMLSKDFLPNRLEAAKDVAKQFILERPMTGSACHFFRRKLWVSPITNR